MEGVDVPFDESGESHSATDIVHSDEELGDIGGGGDPEEVEVVEVGPKRKRSLGSAGDESPTKRRGEADGVPFALQGPGFEAFTRLQDHPEPPEFLRRFTFWEPPIEDHPEPDAVTLIQMPSRLSTPTKQDVCGPSLLFALFRTAWSMPSIQTSGSVG